MNSPLDKDKNLDDIAQDYVEAVKEYNPEPTWNLMQTAVCYGYHYCKEEEQKPTEPSDEELVRHPPITYTYPSDASRDEQLKMALLALLNSDLIKVAGNKFTKQDLIDWVEKRQEQKPAEWSEEDEKIRNELITIMDGGKVTSGTYLSEYVAWLKSLPLRCPKSSDNWRPSEELIGCLERVIAFKHPEPEDIDGCNSLIEQLKKQI